MVTIHGIRIVSALEVDESVDGKRNKDGVDKVDKRDLVVNGVGGHGGIARTFFTGVTFRITSEKIGDSTDVCKGMVIVGVMPAGKIFYLLDF